MGWLDEGGGWLGGIARQVGPYLGRAIEGLTRPTPRSRPPVGPGPTLDELMDPRSGYYTGAGSRGGWYSVPDIGRAVPGQRSTAPPTTVIRRGDPAPVQRTPESAPVPRTTEGGNMGFEGFGISTPLIGGGGYGDRAGAFDWGAAIDWGFDIYDRWKARSSPPGPAMSPSFPQLPGGPTVPGPYTSGPPYASLPPYAGAGTPATTGACMTGFRVMPQHTRAVRMIEQVNPSTGKMHYWKHMGQPILFSGDLANCKRVGRVQAKLNRARPRKR